jgi:hypothetical protein|nr:MAG TPA: Lower collar protein [Caudoviricetes sp.]
MAFVTPQLRRVLDMGYDLGLKHYPIFSESHRQELNEKIVNHFRYREIGYETITQFIFALNRKMFEIMPFYNQLYESEELEISALTNYSYDEISKKTGNDLLEKTGTDTNKQTGDSTRTDTGTQTNEQTGADKQTFEDVKNKTTYGSSENENTTTTSDVKHGQTTTTEGTDTSKRVHSDTPQGMLSANFPESANYASDADVTKSTNASKVSQGGTDSTSGTVKGSKGRTGSDESVQSGGILTTHDTQGKLTNDLNSKNKFNTDSSTTYGSNAKQNYDNQLATNKKGYQGISPSELLQKYRDTFLNIDMLVITELEELFISIF